jgi:uncharacterized protein DUF6754
MSAQTITGLGVIIAAVVLLIIFAILQRTRPPVFRNIASFANLRRSIGMAVEDGTRLHFSLGRGGVTTPFSAAGFAGLSMLRRVAELTSVSDRPPVVTSGDGALAALSQDTLRTSYEAAVAAERYDPNTARLTGLTPFSYAAGALPVMRDENISTNVMAGSFGIEVALMIDAAERSNAFSMVASDNLPAQAVLYASTPNPLIGEELYAAGAYVQAGPFHSASLSAQDVLRWGIIVVIIAGAVLKLVGLL